MTVCTPVVFLSSCPVCSIMVTILIFAEKNILNIERVHSSCLAVYCESLLTEALHDGLHPVVFFVHCPCLQYHGRRFRMC